MNIGDRLRLAWTALRGKSLVDLHPEVEQRVHVAVLRWGEMFAQGPYSYLSAIGNYESSTWVEKAVRTIADNLSAVPLMITRGEEQVSEHPLLSLLTGINDTMSSSDMWKQWTTEMLLGGEEFWELVKNKQGNYVEIWPRQPHTVSVIPDPARRRYFQVEHYRVDDGQGDPYGLPPDECVHFKFFNPRNPWRGIAPITAIRASIVIDQFAQAWSKLFFEQSARPDYAVIAPAGLTNTEREDIEKKLTFKFGGVENAHKPVVLEQGVSDIKILSFPPKDMEWIEHRKVTREEIGAIFGVPDEIMGWGRDTYENFDTAHHVLWALTIVPLCAHRDTHLTEYFQRQKVLKPDERITSDFSNVSALKIDLSKKVEMADRLLGRGIPFNLVNHVIGLGFPDLEGGDVGYLPISLVPVMNLRAQGAGGKARIFSMAKKPSMAPEFGSDEHKRLWDTFCKRTEPGERLLSKKVIGLFEQQREAVLSDLRASGKMLTESDCTGLSLAEAAQKALLAFKGPEQIAEDPFDMDEWVDEFRRTVRPVLETIVAESGQAALDDLALGMVFDVGQPAVVEFLMARAQRFAERVNETTWDELKRSLADGINSGENIPQLEQRVLDVMAERIRSTPETIARTEVVGAANGGTLEAWKQSEVVEEKTWLAALDERTRDSHVDAHGQTVRLDEDFHVGNGSGPAPGQIGIAEEDINCRCTMRGMVGERAMAARGTREVELRRNGHKGKVIVGY